jgi:hypothetical protein
VNWAPIVRGDHVETVVGTNAGRVDICVQAGQGGPVIGAAVLPDLQGLIVVCGRHVQLTAVLNQKLIRLRVRAGQGDPVNGGESVLLDPDDVIAEVGGQHAKHVAGCRDAVDGGVRTSHHRPNSVIATVRRSRSPRAAID